MAAKKITFLLLALFPFIGSAQHQDSVNTKRLRSVAIAGGVGYGITLAALNELWYKNSPRQSFRFFNDNPEWKQVDKLGHFYSAFYISYGTSEIYKWCGLHSQKSDLLGALTGFLVLLPVEIFDGFSQAYGASVGDLVADAGGALFFVGQTYLWKTPRIYPKFSFNRTDFPSIRPTILGDNLMSEFLKDYNGQTYWFSFDMDKFIKFPKWLNLAVGYGATGMVYARDQENTLAGYDSYRQYYFSFDLDLKAIQTRSKILRTTFSILSLIKIPSPAFEFSRNGTKFHILF